jgi:hypothetical protein
MEKDRHFEAYVYDGHGQDYEDAWNLMREKFEVPPSFEVFQRGLGDSGFDKPQDYAKFLCQRGK